MNVSFEESHCQDLQGQLYHQLNYLMMPCNQAFSNKLTNPTDQNPILAFHASQNSNRRCAFKKWLIKVSIFDERSYL